MALYTLALFFTDTKGVDGREYSSHIMPKLNTDYGEYVWPSTGMSDLYDVDQAAE